MDLESLLDSFLDSVDSHTAVPAPLAHAASSESAAAAAAHAGVLRGVPAGAFAAAAAQFDEPASQAQDFARPSLEHLQPLARDESSASVFDTMGDIDSQMPVYDLGAAPRQFSIGARVYLLWSGACHDKCAVVIFNLSRRNVRALQRPKVNKK